MRQYIRPYVSGCAGSTCGDRRWLCIIGDSGGDPHTEHLSKNGSAALCVLPFGGFGSNFAAMFPLPHLSPQPRDTHTTCQIHSVITGLIKTVHRRSHWIP